MLRRIRRRFNKVAVVGAGMVGSTFAYSLMISGLAAEIVLIDQDRSRSEGQAMDLSHGGAFTPPVRIHAGEIEDCKGADIVALTAGMAQKPGQSRLDLVKGNADIMKAIVPKMVEVNREAILLVVTNPVDIMTYAVLKISGLPKERVIGSGTLLDSSRFRHLLSRHCRIAPSNVHAQIIGEHGDSEVPVWSTANIAGIRLDEYCPVCGMGCSEKVRERIFTEVRDAAYAIIQRKGATYYAIGLAMTAIAKAVLRDENSVMTLSCLTDGIYGIKDICLSMPVVVNRGGISKVLKSPLTPLEEEGLRRSASILSRVAEEAGLK